MHTLSWRSLAVLPAVLLGLVFAWQVQAAEPVRSAEGLALQKVTDVTVTDKKPRKVSLRWDDQANEDAYQVRVVTYKNRNLVDKKRSEDNQATVDGLKPDRKYVFKIRARKADRFGEYSKERVIETDSLGNAQEITISDLGNQTVGWEIAGSAPNGVKVVWSKNEHPTYPTRDGDMYSFYSNVSFGSATYSDEPISSAKLKAFDGTGTYYVRVCEYLGNGTCGIYSNEIAMQLEAAASTVNSIALTQSGDNAVSWSVDGEASNGFKLVWSRDSGPTYPPRDGDYAKYQSSDARSSDALYAFDGSGTYYVRICEYLDGSCGTYSNEIAMTL
jgi:hypothetical protein